MNSNEKTYIKVLRKMDQYLLWTENCLGGIAYTVMVIVVFVGVILRYFIKIPNLYGEELSRYLMVACIYLGIAAGCRKKVHLSVSMFVDMLPSKLNKAVSLVVRLFTVIVYCYVAFLGFGITKDMRGFGQSSPAMKIPLWIMYGVITGAFCLCALTEIMLFVNDFFIPGILNDGIEEEMNL